MEDKSNASPVVNRDEPIPVLPSEDQDGSEAKAGEPKSTLSSKLQGGIQDRLISALLQQMMPTSATPNPTVSPAKRLERPGFSLGLMSTNFRRFNARIGVAFVFQAKLIRIFSWKIPTQTLSFLAIYSFCCMNPYLLTILPLVLCLFFVMVPAFTARHPPPPNSTPTDIFAMRGPASAPPPNIKPAPEMSKDFFRNMRDLQNSMEDFSVLHDSLIKLLAPMTNFSDERLSSALFLVLVVAIVVLFFVGNLIPWRALFLLGGWAAICSSHPALAKAVAPFGDLQGKANSEQARDRFRKWIDQDINLTEAPEARDVEIFELQHHIEGDEWQSWIYCTSPFDPLSPSRMSGDRPKGTRFFEDVQAPKGWEWKDKKWTLDLLSRDWIEERMITAVEVETEGERWVYDIAIEPPRAPYSPSKTSHNAFRKDWEETTVPSSGSRGEWRRRRWTRAVKRNVSKGEAKRQSKGP